MGLGMWGIGMDGIGMWGMGLGMLGIGLDGIGMWSKGLGMGGISWMGDTVMMLPMACNQGNEALHADTYFAEIVQILHSKHDVMQRISDWEDLQAYM